MSYTPITSRTAAERFITIVRCLSAAVVAMMAGDQLPAALIKLVADRLRGIQQRFLRSPPGSAPEPMCCAGAPPPRASARANSHRKTSSPPPSAGWCRCCRCRTATAFARSSISCCRTRRWRRCWKWRPRRCAGRCGRCAACWVSNPRRSWRCRPKRPATAGGPGAAARPASARSARAAAALHAAGAAAVLAGPGIPRPLRPAPNRLEMTGGEGTHAHFVLYKQ